MTRYHTEDLKRLEAGSFESLMRSQDEWVAAHLAQLPAGAQVFRHYPDSVVVIGETEAVCVYLDNSPSGLMESRRSKVQLRTASAADVQRESLSLVQALASGDPSAVLELANTVATLHSESKAAEDRTVQAVLNSHSSVLAWAQVLSTPEAQAGVGDVRSTVEQWKSAPTADVIALVDSAASRVLSAAGSVHVRRSEVCTALGERQAAQILAFAEASRVGAERARQFVVAAVESRHLFRFAESVASVLLALEAAAKILTSAGSAQ